MNSRAQTQRRRAQLPLISDMEGNRYDTIRMGPERDHTDRPFISVNI